MRELSKLEKYWIAEGLRLNASEALKNRVSVIPITQIIQLSEEFYNESEMR